MKYAVIPHMVYRTAGRGSAPAVSWQVVDIEAGTTDRSFARVVLARCKQEADANRICAMYNGAGMYPDNIKAVQAERDAAVAEGKRICVDLERTREALQTWQDKCTSLMAEREEARRLLRDVERQRDEYAAERRAAIDRAKYWENQVSIARDNMAPIRAMEARIEAALKILEEGRKS